MSLNRIVMTCVGMLLLATSSSVCDAEPNAKPKEQVKHILLIAGKKSHGPEGNRIHDYPWSVRLIKVMLERSNIKDRVKVDYVLDGWPANAAERLKWADTIFITSDGRDGDKFSEAPHLDGDDRVALVDEQMKRGCGLVLFHFSTFGPDQYAPQMFRWTGGYFDWDEGQQHKWYSAIKTIDADVKAVAPEHEVLRGVKPFKMNEEFYFNLRFDPSDKVTTPILEVPALGGRAERGNVVAWARQREESNGRGFGTSCGHFYDNWKNDDFRKTILNAIAWTAHVGVPKEGVEAPYVEREEIKKALNDFRDEQRQP